MLSRANNFPPTEKIDVLILQTYSSVRAARLRTSSRSVFVIVSVAQQLPRGFFRQFKLHQLMAILPIYREIN